MECLERHKLLKIGKRIKRKHKHPITVKEIEFIINFMQSPKL